MKYSEGIERFGNGSLGVRNKIHRSPLGRTYRNYLKLKVNEMIVDGYNRNGLNEVIAFWKGCSKPKGRKQRILKMLKPMFFVTSRLK